jgi:hypothetical protein
MSILSCGRSAVPVILSRNFFAPSRLELGELAGEVLDVGRDDRVAVNQCPHCASEICIKKKRNRVNALGLIQIS